MKRFKNILLVANRKAGGNITFRRAVALARRNQALLTVVGVLETWPDEMQKVTPTLPPKDIQEMARQELGEQLMQLTAPVKQEGLQVTTKVLCGKPFLEIIREVLRNQHDLVMMTAEGKGGLKEMLLGSTALHLMRKCPCPVWVLKPTQRSQYARILAAVDPDPYNEEKTALNYKIMELATSLAHLEGSELYIIHTWFLFGERALRGRSRLSPGEMAKLLQETKNRHKKWLNELLEKFSLKKLRHQIHLLKGDPGKLIPELAKKKSVELIVMGTVCRTGVAGFLIGNTVEKVLHQVDCSVLTIKPEGFVTPIRLDE